MNFLLGYLYFKKKDFAKAGGHLVAASNFSPRNAQVLTLLGRVGLEREDYPSARLALEQAILLDSKIGCRMICSRPLTFARASMRKRAMKPRSQSARASRPPVRPNGSWSLSSELGRHQEAIEALDRFLKESPHNPVADQVRTMRRRFKPSQFLRLNWSAIRRSSFRIQSACALPAPELSVKSWQPQEWMRSSHTSLPVWLALLHKSSTQPASASRS